MEDFSELAFECILQPSLLDAKVFINRKIAVGVLRQLLSQLSNVTKTQIAINNEVQSHQPDPGSLRKKAFIQLMVVRISAYLEWKFEELNDSPSLQLLILETISSVLKEDSKFAKTLFNRWILRTSPILNYPTPPLNKAQIFNNNSNIYCVIDAPTATTVQNSSAEALKYLTQAENVDIDTIPSANSFKIGNEIEKEFLPECSPENWVKLDKNLWMAQILADLIPYYLFTEDYEECRNCIKKIKDLNKVDQVLEKKKFLAYQLASGFKESTLEEKPLYHKINEELSLKYKGQQKSYENLLVKNMPLRLQENLPFPHSEEALKKVDLQGLDTLVQYLKGDKKVSYGKPPNFSEKSEKSKSKSAKTVKKRDLLLSLMREKRPEKILKLIQDLQKMNVNIRRAITRWHLDDMSIVQAAGRSIDSDYVFILLVKAQQLTQMQLFEESMDLLTATEKLFNDKPWSADKNKAMNYLQMLKINLKMTEYQESKGQIVENDFIPEVKECFEKFLTNANEAQSQVFEMLVATLLNLDQFEFILKQSGKSFNMIRLACLISSTVLNFHRKPHTSDFKETCRSLADIILPVLQQNPQKRSRDRDNQNQVANQEKAWIKRLLKRIHSPQVLSVLCAFLVTYYNSTNEDALLEIQCELPPLPLTVNSSISINEDSLLSFIQILAGNSRNPCLSWSLRIQGEVQYAQGNYLAAMQNFITSLVVSTQFFLKPWSNLQSLQDATWDERIFNKMIKCTSELGHHAESMILCQFLGEVDYVTAFKALEERSGFDGMDALYQYLWDVTILEYAVSMHSKKGELSRKKKALEAISQLEINTNNNEEILREAQAARRSSFLRYMAANYIR